MGIEQAAAKLQKEHVNLSDALQNVRKEIKSTDAILKELNRKFQDATSHIDRLEEENNELKEQVGEIHDRSVTHINESKNQ